MKNKFPRISDAKINEGISFGPQIRELIQEIKSEDQLSEVEKAARKTFKNATTIFFLNHEAESYRDMVTDLEQSYKAMWRNMYEKRRIS